MKKLTGNKKLRHAANERKIIYACAFARQGLRLSSKLKFAGSSRAFSLRLHSRWGLIVFATKFVQQSVRRCPECLVPLEQSARSVKAQVHLQVLLTRSLLNVLYRSKNSTKSEKRIVRVVLSVIVRENRAGPKDRGRPFTFIFSQYKSYPKRLITVIFAEVGVRFSSRYHHIMILASQAV